MPDNPKDVCRSSVVLWINECSDKYGVQYIPHTVLIDRKGHIVGVNLEEPEIEAILFGE